MESKFLNQRAVYLEAAGKDAYGKFIVRPAIEIRVRWEERVEQVQDPNGTFKQSSDVVFTDQDIAEGSVMWLGALKDFAEPYSDLREVLKFRKTPNIKGRRFRRKALLVRASNKLPNIVAAS